MLSKWNIRLLTNNREARQQNLQSQSTMISKNNQVSTNWIVSKAKLKFFKKLMLMVNKLNLSPLDVSLASNLKAYPCYNF